MSRGNEADNIRKLKEAYDLCAAKVKELSPAGAQGSSLYSRVHGQRASKVYTALSSLLYCSLAIAKVPALEEFVLVSAAALPVQVIDLALWQPLLDIARAVRGQR